MIKKIIPLSLLFLTFSHAALAAQNTASADLRAERERVVREYVLDLEKADYKNITTLFNKDGTVVSTSKGHVNAKEFFYAFLPNVESATTEFHQGFISNEDNNHLAARFHFHFKLKDGETGDGEYVDEFIFSDHSTKLTSVYMFENLKFN